MKLKKIDLTNRDFKYIKKQLKFGWPFFYLVKYDDQWRAGCFHFCNASGRTNPGKPNNYDFSMGLFSARLNSRDVSGNEIDEKFQEIHEIIDPVLLKEAAKGKLIEN